MYLDIQKNGYVKEKDIESLYCENDKLFLPDRFIEGTCPNCKDEEARGDQCDKCQKLLTPLELINPRLHRRVAACSIVYPSGTVTRNSPALPLANTS